MSCPADLRPPPRVERRRTWCPFSGTTSEPAFEPGKATMLLDLEGKVVFCDEAGASMFRGCVADLLGRRIDSLVADLPLDRNTPGYNLAYVDFSFSTEHWQRFRGFNLEGRVFPLELSMSAVALDGRHAFLLHLRRPRDLWPALAQTQRLASRNVNEEELARDIPKNVSQVANYDRLTGLPTAALFLDRLHQALAQAARRECGFCLLDLQLDEFKKVELRRGATGAEEMLQAVAQRLKHCVREEDTLARIGKDEFAFILMDLGQRSDAEKVLDKLCAALHQGVMIQGQRIALPASIGVCLFPHDGEDELSLLRHAECAMLQAKAAGGERYWFHGAPEAVRQISLFDEQAPEDAAPGATLGTQK